MFCTARASDDPRGRPYDTMATLLRRAVFIDRRAFFKPTGKKFVHVHPSVPPAGRLYYFIIIIYFI